MKILPLSQAISEAKAEQALQVLEQTMSDLLAEYEEDHGKIAAIKVVRTENSAKIAAFPVHYRVSREKRGVSVCDEFMPITDDVPNNVLFQLYATTGIRLDRVLTPATRSMFTHYYPLPASPK
jgi:hypothetical protein